jgi:hypothetical protein
VLERQCRGGKHLAAILAREAVTQESNPSRPADNALASADA